MDIQGKYGDKEAIALAAKLGADGIDFDLASRNVTKENDIYTLGVEAVREYYTSLRKYAEEVGVKISQTHGRFLGYGNSEEGNEIFVKNSELDEYVKLLDSVFGEGSAMKLRIRPVGATKLF